MDVQVADDWWKKQHRSYFVWLFGKPPDVVIEIVSNRVGEEDGRKRDIYAQISAKYYVLFDPQELLSSDRLRVYELRGNRYVLLNAPYLDQFGLGITLWHGSYEGKAETWLRWCDLQGNLIPTGRERAEQERERADQERERADQALAEIERLRARLRESGLDE
jgi:hypothetical protein